MTEAAHDLGELHERARHLLATGDAEGACVLLEKVVELAPRHLQYWMSLAAALRVLGRREAELDVLERALALNPRHLVVLLQKGALLELMHKPRSAATVYAHALRTLVPGTVLPPPIEAHVRHAELRVRENAATLGILLEERLSALRKDTPARVQLRFDRCLDRLLGRRGIFAPDPTFMLFPYLNNYEFFESARFPWLEDVEAVTEEIREELLAVLRDDQAGIEPYIDFEDGLPLSQWKDLNHSRRWGAYFLWNQGRKDQNHLARCPRTAAMLAKVPQVDIPERGPTALFSILEAHTKIPPHTGVTNTRLTVHLPLMVPPGCGFRVGGEIREWQVGKAWVFDDTIEHEAWNESSAARAILIFDVWNPELTPLECSLVRETTIALAQYHADEGTVPGVQL
jgi:aspartate beta-hydroxylase